MDPVTFLQGLVTIPSLSGQETAVARYLVSTMQALGLAAHIDETGNVIGVRECPDDEGQVTRELVLLGHMDTVPGEIPVRLENGRLHGRGTVDAKGPLAAFVIAAAEADLQPGRRLVVIGAVEEESATSKGARHVLHQYRPDWCLIGEPSGWDGVTLGYKGRLLIDYEYRQSMSHTAGADSGAAEAGIAWYNRLATAVTTYNHGRNKLFAQLLPSIRHIQTDSDGLCNTVHLKIGIRLPPEFDVAAFTADIQSWSGEATVRFYGFEPAFQAGRRSDLARAFNVALRQEAVRPRFKLKTGTSDMNVVGPVWQCPIVAYGPGDSALDHTPVEHIEVAEYLQAITVLKTVINQF